MVRRNFVLNVLALVKRAFSFVGRREDVDLQIVAACHKLYFPKIPSRSIILHETLLLSDVCVCNTIVSD
jgi:hypothetical protein